MSRAPNAHSIASSDFFSFEFANDVNAASNENARKTEFRFFQYAIMSTLVRIVRTTLFDIDGELIMLEHQAANDDKLLAGYAALNASWGCDPRTMRKPSPKEAIKACRLLLAEGFRAFDRPDLARRKRKFKLTSGRNYTWPHSGVWRVNPDQCGTGFAEIVHMVSHYVHREVNPGLARKRGGGHEGHVMVEQHLVDFVRRKRWVEDGMRVAPEKVAPSKDDRRAQRKSRLERRLKSWQTKSKRAATAIKKLSAQLKRFE